MVANHGCRLALYIPFRAVLILFTHILTSPGVKTAQSDLVLMDVAAGYASRLEFAADGSLSFPFIKDLARFAREAVDRTRAQGMESSHNLKTQMPVVPGLQGTEVDADLNFIANEADQFQEVSVPFFIGKSLCWRILFFPIHVISNI